MPFYVFKKKKSQKKSNTEFYISVKEVHLGVSSNSFINCFFFLSQMTPPDSKWQKDAADQNFDYMFKLLIIGNSSVGKTSFLFRYADDSFTSAFVSTVGIDFKVKTVFRHDKRVKLQIWVSYFHECVCDIYCQIIIFRVICRDTSCLGNIAVPLVRLFINKMQAIVNKR